MFSGEALRAFAYEIYVRTFTQNFSRSAHRIAQALDAAHAAGAERRAIHDEGVELYLAIAIKKAAATCIESVVVFHDDDRFLDCVERRAAAFEHAPSRSERLVHAAQVSVDHVIGHGPGTAMNDEHRIGRQDCPRKKTGKIMGQFSRCELP